MAKSLAAPDLIRETTFADGVQRVLTHGGSFDAKFLSRREVECGWNPRRA